MSAYIPTARRLRALASYLDSGGDPELIGLTAEGGAEDAIRRADDEEATVSRFMD